MKIIRTLVALFALIAPVPLATHAQTTNVYLNARFNLTVSEQDFAGSVPKIVIRRITNRDIIQSLAAQLALPTNQMVEAKLMLRMTLDASAGFILRMGTNDTDLTGLLDYSFPQTVGYHSVYQ